MEIIHTYPSSNSGTPDESSGIVGNIQRFTTDILTVLVIYSNDVFNDHHSNVSVLTSKSKLTCRLSEAVLRVS